MLEGTDLGYEHLWVEYETDAERATCKPVAFTNWLVTLVGLVAITEALD